MINIIRVPPTKLVEQHQIIKISHESFNPFLCILRIFELFYRIFDNLYFGENLFEFSDKRKKILFFVKGDIARCTIFQEDFKAIVKYLIESSEEYLTHLHRKYDKFKILYL